MSVKKIILNLIVILGLALSAAAYAGRGSHHEGDGNNSIRGGHNSYSYGYPDSNWFFGYSFLDRDHNSGHHGRHHSGHGGGHHGGGHHGGGHHGGGHHGGGHHGGGQGH